MRDAWSIAGAYIELGDKHQAFTWLAPRIWIYSGDPLIRNDPRFATLKRKIGVQFR